MGDVANFGTLESKEMMKEKIPEPSKRFILGHFIWVHTSKIIPKNLGTTWRIVENDIEKDDHLQRIFFLVVIHRPLRATV